LIAARVEIAVSDETDWVLGGWDFFATDGGTETFNNEVWSKADGVNWTKHTPIGTAWSPRAGHEAVAFNGKIRMGPPSQSACRMYGARRMGAPGRRPWTA
jgi:hypothetical protein